MKIYLFTILTLFSFLICSGQNSSFGLNLSAFDHIDDRETGIAFGANLRADISKVFALQIGTDYLKSSTTNILTEVTSKTNGSTSITESYNQSYLATHLSLIVKVFKLKGISGDFSIGTGIIKDRRKIWLLYRNELFLSTQITKNITAGIPLVFNVVTWRRDIFYTAGFSIRYYY